MEDEQYCGYIVIESKIVSIIFFKDASVQWNLKHLFLLKDFSFTIRLLHEKVVFFKYTGECVDFKEASKLCKL